MHDGVNITGYDGSELVGISSSCQISIGQTVKIEIHREISTVVLEFGESERIEWSSTGKVAS